jgi:hypothetical protein
MNSALPTCFEWFYIFGKQIEVGAMTTRSSYDALLNAIPMPVFIVDGDLVVTNTNSAANEVFDIGESQAKLERWGRVVQCINSFDHALGCGHSSNCKVCLIRNLVAECLNGSKIVHQKSNVVIKNVEGPVCHEFLVTFNQIVVNGNLLALFIVENVTKLVLGKETIPMCMHCKKLRDNDRHWSKIEDYLDNNLHIKFSHCICESCLFEHYPDIASKKLVEG